MRNHHHRHDRERLGHISASHARFRGILWGGLLLAAGTWFLLQRLGVDLPNFFSALWPIFPFMFGFAFLVTFFTGPEKDPGLVWPGTFGVLIGAFFFLFSFGVFRWDQMSELWPVFPLVVGISFVTTWLATNCKKLGLLVPATINLGVGIVGLAFTVGTIDAHTVNLLWPLGLVALGAFLIARSLRRPRPPAAPLSVESSRRDE
jgi:cell wall-active antibiotic response 4TMS protein YvqF